MKRNKKIIVLCILITNIFLLTGCENETLFSLYFHDESVAGVVEQLITYKAQLADSEKIPTGNDEIETSSGTTVPDESENSLDGLEEAAVDVSKMIEKRSEMGGYYYNSLSESVQVVYREIYKSLTERKEVVISTLSQDTLDLVFQSVLYDHPEIFYVSGYQATKHLMDEQVVKLTIVGKYDMTEEEVTNYQTQIDQYCEECFTNMPPLDEYGKVKYIFDYLIENTKYNLNAENNQNICSVFIGRESVCQGYAEATQYLLQKLGFEITIVTGDVNNGESHAWNLVKVNDEYYYLDTTWGDVDYQEIGGASTDYQFVPKVNYDYFLINSSQLIKTHNVKTIIPMPTCTALTDNYYIREGSYFEQFDYEKLVSVFEKATSEGVETVTIKAASTQVFYEIKNYLIDEQNIFQYIDAKGSVAFYEDEIMGTLCFWLE